MNRRFLLLLLTAALSGCASFDKTELATVRSRGVSPAVVTKLDRGDAVTPADVVELTRRGVRDEWIIRQIEDHGVDSFVSRTDVNSLRRAGVRPAVIDALIKASDRFASDYRYGDSAYFESSYLGDPYFDYYGPYAGYWGGGLGATFVIPRHHSHCHRH